MHETSSKRHGLSDSSHDLDQPRANRPLPGLALDPPDAPPPDHPPEIPVERLDPDALKVIARLRHMGHLAYLVGGCVRDLLLDRAPKDFDVATDAHPGEVRAIFRNCRLIGRRFRLAHVYFRGGKFVEVATFRKNPIDVAEDVPEGGDLLITRDNVFGTAEEDALRRDFTVNGLFYDVVRGKVIDFVGGREDLEAARISTIGDPEIRIREDPVRALRAVRFAARLGFTIAPDTFEAVRRHAGELSRCAPARVLEETFKILRCGSSARAFELLRASGVLPIVLPALAAALETWDEAGRESFLAHLAALDRLVRSGEEVSDAVLLGALLMHLGALPSVLPEQRQTLPEEVAATGAREFAEGGLAHKDEGPGSRPNGSPRRISDADALLASLVSTSRLPRKVAERARLALRAQRMFRDPQRRRRRRGRFRGQPHFADTAQLLRIGVEATGNGHELLERWTAAASGGPPQGLASGPAELAQRAPAPQERARGGPALSASDARAEDQPGSHRRRRRRGGRRRRRRSGSTTVTPGPLPRA